MALFRQFLVILMKRLIEFSSAQQLVVPLLLATVFEMWRFGTHRITWTTLKQNPLDEVFPALGTAGLIITYQIVMAARDLNRHLLAETKNNHPTIIHPDNIAREPSQVPAVIVAAVLVCFVWLVECLLVEHAYPVEKLPVLVWTPGPPPPSATFDHNGSSVSTRTGILPTRSRFSVTFGDSALLTQARKKRIDSDVSAFYRYLDGLGIRPLPDTFPPLQVISEPNFMTVGVLGQPFYTWKLAIYAPRIDSQSEIISLYANYAFMRMMPRDQSSDGSQQPSNMMQSVGVLTDYFTGSFMGSYKSTGGTDSGSRWTDALWDVRKHFGPTLTDLSVAYTALNIFGNNNRKDTGNFDVWFFSFLDNGVAIVDSRVTKQEAVHKVLAEHGLHPSSLSPR